MAKKAKKNRQGRPDPSAAYWVRHVQGRPKSRLSTTAIVAALIIAIGGSAAYLLATGLWKSVKSGHYAEVSAVLDEPETLSYASFWPGGRFTAPSVRTYRAVYVEYHYLVNGSLYRGEVGPSLLGNRTRLRDLELPVGAGLKIYYDPRKPSDSSLVRGFDWSELSPADMGYLLGTGILALAGLGFIAYLAADRFRAGAAGGRS